MLVLTRKAKEEIHIGNNITITIVRIKGQTVRVGIKAPRDVRVIRGELTAFDDSKDQANDTVSADVSADTACGNPASDTRRSCGPRRLAETRLPQSRDRLKGNRRPGLTAIGLLAERARERRANELDS